MAPPFIVAEGSGENLADWFAVVHVEAFAAGDFQAARVEAELMQHRGVDVGDVMAILDGVKAQFVGDTVLHAALDATAGEPGAEALWMMIAPGAFRTR